MASPTGFALTGDFIDVAEGMLTLADLGGRCGYARDEVLMLRTYWLDFDATYPSVRLPVCFGKEYGSYVMEYVMLRDPKNNEIEVQVENLNNKFYLRTGWFGLKDFYQIKLGAWVDITYESPRLFKMAVRNRFGEEISYPDHTPPIISKLDHRVSEGNLVYFQCAATVVLTAANADSGYLMLPWLGFCQHAMPRVDTEINVIDYMGFAWRCDFKFVQHDKSLAYKIGGDWGKICRARQFTAGRCLDLAVTKEKGNDTIYLRHVPDPCLHEELLRGMEPRMWLSGDAAVFSLQEVGSDIDVVQRDASWLKTYRVELEIETPKARLPAYFAKEYSVHIDDYVALCDPKNNLTVVQVDKKNDKIYFREGWLRLKTVYNIELGAWITLTYTQPNLLHMTIKARTGVEISYPDNPSLAIPKFIGPVAEVSLVQFFRTHVKILTSSDVQSGYLMLRWNGFCPDVLPTEQANITIIDCLEFPWKCDMSFVMVKQTMYCKIGGDWGTICNAHGLVEGNALKLAVH